ncbi:poly(ethylene terephthalate) hydrolase family protein [Flavobacterium sp. XGLA_31]|uniref:poly(ethylene terephthalate) hydrolase family protein n=1 Tax=Flavobacterium sp. XGLA_31 TaxID=3447666 RepID=UPI003F38B9F8
MKSKITLAVLFAVQFGFSQLFQVGHTTVNFTDTSRGNRVIATEIYYPADAAGDNVPVTTSTTAVFPVLSFGHGFVMTWDAYQNFWSSLVPNGYIMVFPKTEGSLAPSHLDFGKDLSFVLDQMAVLNTNATSLFYNKISPMNAVMGHSMGGGASFLAAQLNTNIKTLVNFAAAETNPSAIQAAASIQIPSLIFSGGNDCVTPPNTNQIPMYNELLSNCKTLLTILGGSHCQMANSNFFCGVGESSCSPQPTITRAAQQNIINTYLLPWLDFQLKGNCAQGNSFDTQLLSDNSISFQKNCIQCNSLTTDNFENNNGIRLTPVPVKDIINVSGIEGRLYTITIYDSSAKELLTKVFTTETTIETVNLPKGIYFYSLQSQGIAVSTGKFIK